MAVFISGDFDVQDRKIFFSSGPARLNSLFLKSFDYEKKKHDC